LFFGQITMVTQKWARNPAQEKNGRTETLRTKGRKQSDDLIKKNTVGNRGQKLKLPGREEGANNTLTSGWPNRRRSPGVISLRRG